MRMCLVGINSQGANMVKFVSLLMCLSLLEFGAASIMKAPSRSIYYQPALSSQSSPEVVSNTSPEAAQDRPSHTGHQGPEPGSNMALGIRETDGDTRKSRNLNSNGKLTIAIELSLKIDGVNQLRGCAEEKNTEKPTISSAENHNVGDQYIPVEQSLSSEPTFNSVDTSQNWNNHDININPLAPSEVTTEDFNMDKFLAEDPGEPVFAGQ